MLGIALARIYQVINLYRLEGRDSLLDEADEMVTRAMALAPNGASLYVNGSEHSSVVNYRREAGSGALSFSDCLTGNFGGPCTELATVKATTLRRGC